MGNFIDLHIHSTYSDGRYNPQKILEEANKNQVGLISITDHDTIDAYKHENLASSSAINIINGVEISSLYVSKKGKSTRIHILGYDLNLDNLEINNLFENLKDIRYQVNCDYIKFLQSKFSFISSDIKSIVDCSKYYRIGWAVVQALMKLNMSNEQIREVNKFVWNNYPNYNDYDIPSNRTINTIKRAGGIPILAHPYSYHLNDLEIKRMIKDLIAMGIEGIEAYHSECSLENMKKLRMYVESYKLLYSVGSDFHFPTEKDNKIIGHGINENLCKTECTLANKVLTLRKR